MHELGSITRDRWRRRLVCDDLLANAVNFPTRAAVRDVATAQVWTFSAFARRVCWVASGLHQRFGLRPGDRVALMGRNRPDMLTAYFAASAVGAITVPLNHHATDDELRFVLDDCEPSLVVAAEESLPRFPRALLGDRQLLAFDAAGSRDGLDALVGDGDCAAPDVDVDEWAPAYVIYTGGSTGKPKGVVQSQANYVANADHTIALFAPLGLGREDAYLHVLPLHHGAGWGLCFSFLHFAVPVHLMGEFDGQEVAAELESGAYTVACTVPTMSRRILDAARSRPADAFDRVRIYVSLGGPLSADMRAELAHCFRRAAIVNSVGQTEVTGAVMALTEPSLMREKPGSVGFPVPGLAVRVLDADGQPLPPGETGEIAYRGDQVMLGYWRRPDLTREAIVDGWVRSGDMGWRDADGTMHLAGRKDEMIISGGVNIWPAEIENVVREVEGVLDVCALGLPDPEWGERVHAVVACGQLATEGERLRERIETHCRARLSSYKVPKTWTFLDTLPMTAVGKIDRPELRALILAQLPRSNAVS